MSPQPQLPSPILKFFAYEHLPPHLQPVAMLFAGLAESFDESLPHSAEKSAGLRKLLEAKDCIVRSVIEAREPR